MNIEEIMKPYFDKIEEINQKVKVDDSLQEKTTELMQQKVFIELRLDRLKMNKEQEIEEYVKNAVSDRPDFYSGYGAMIRKDLEQSYLNREQELINQINSINNELQEIEKFNQEKIAMVQKFHNVDVRELSEVKNSLRLPLNQAKKELEFKLEETKLSFDNIMLKLSRFEYVYDENHKVVNGDEYRKLFDESNHLIEVKYSIQNQLNKINEYLSLTELTQEEIAVSMMSMTPWERDEYDRRKSSITIDPLVQQNDIEPDLTEEPFDFASDEKDSETISTEVEDNEEIDYVPEEVQVDKFDFDVDNLDFDDVLNYNDVYSGFIEMVYEDIMKLTKNQRVVKLPNEDFTPDSELMNDEYEEDTATILPNGVHLYKRDLYKALNNYVKKNKGQTFEVNGIELVIDKKAVRDLKKDLRECCAVKLLRDKKLGFFDIKRVYGKDKANKYKSLGEMHTKLPSGKYIDLDKFGVNLKELFVEKSPSWLEKLREKIKTARERKNMIDKEEIYDLDEYDNSSFRMR